MRLFSHIFSRIVIVFFVVSVLVGIQPLKAEAAPVCFCTVQVPTNDLPKNVDLSIFNDPSKFDRQCLSSVPTTGCFPGAEGIDKKFDECDVVDSPEICASRQAEFDKDVENTKQLVIRGKNGTLPTSGDTSASGGRPQGLLASVLPDCVFDNTVRGECKDVNIFIKLAIDLANVLLSIIGGVALIAFLYGGFILILSEGNSEKIEKGKGAMVAALIGLAVVFGAYLIVNVLSDALGVGSVYRLQ